MGSIPEIIDAVKRLTPTEQSELLAQLREIGFGTSHHVEADSDFTRYESDEFTQELTESFHRAKRGALGADEPS
jgi:hypothetical protein